jgi:hypothetical protein
VLACGNICRNAGIMGEILSLECGWSGGNRCGRAMDGCAKVRLGEWHSSKVTTEYEEIPRSTLEVSRSLSFFRILFWQSRQLGDVHIRLTSTRHFSCCTTSGTVRGSPMPVSWRILWSKIRSS